MIELRQLCSNCGERSSWVPRLPRHLPTTCPACTTGRILLLATSHGHTFEQLHFWSSYFQFRVWCPRCQNYDVLLEREPEQGYSTCFWCGTEGVTITARCHGERASVVKYGATKPQKRNADWMVTQSEREGRTKGGRRNGKSTGRPRKNAATQVKRHYEEIEA